MASEFISVLEAERISVACRSKFIAVEKERSLAMLFLA